MAGERSSGDVTPKPFGSDAGNEEEKGKKRSLFGLGRKKDQPKMPSLPQQETSQLSSTTNRSSPRPQQPPASPHRIDSPLLASPARSQIFERDVQDSTTLQANSPAIPTHIQTENHIPPVLDDASEAITNRKLDPDSVEIVTHNSHQPAAVTVTGTSPPAAGTPADGSNAHWTDELNTFANREAAVVPDNASNYGSLDSADVRRLSFISFADVVQSEHAGGGPPMTGSRDNIHMAGLTSIPPHGLNRSPSPIRSPVSSQGGGIGTSPPTSNPGSVKGLEMSPVRKPLGSPGGASGGLAPPLGGELNVETMSQALRRTTSSDLSHVRSIPTSPIEPPGIKELPLGK